MDHHSTLRRVGQIYLTEVYASVVSLLFPSPPIIKWPSSSLVLMVASRPFLDEFGSKTISSFFLLFFLLYTRYMLPSNSLVFSFYIDSHIVR